MDLPAGTLLFHRSPIPAAGGTGIDGYTIEIPAGWQGQAQVMWVLERTAAPSDLAMRVLDPQAGQEFFYFPSTIYIWSPVFSAKVGTSMRGCEILEPLDGPVPSLEKLVIPDNLKDIEGKYRVVSSQELPELAAAYAPTYGRPGRTPVVRAGKVRVEYDEAGRTIQQDFYCVFILTSGKNGSIWELDHVLSFKEEKGIPDQTERQFALMAASLLPTTKYLDAMDQLTGLLLRSDTKDPKALMAQVTSAVNAPHELSPAVMANWRARQAAMAVAADSYGAGGARRVVTERDPHSGALVPVPGDSLHAWSDSEGDIVYTDSASFRPSDIKPADWQELTPATP
jgi:hypothetical protein